MAFFFVLEWDKRLVFADTEDTLMLVDVEVGFGWLVVTMLDSLLPLVGWE